MHPRNRHQDRYDLKALVDSLPALSPFIIKNKYGNESIDFSDPMAVKTLNQALIKHHYGIDWDLPKDYLCPPIPGRADYIHNLADLIKNDKKSIRVLDIGVGANCIYPIIGLSEYGWNFVGSDINPKALDSAQEIIDRNPSLKNRITLRVQKNPDHIFKGIIESTDFFDLTMCNPPFHISLEAAQEGTNRKWKNLGKAKKETLNFGGTGHELWTQGGEKTFIRKMIEESKAFASQVNWFSTLVSKEEHLSLVYKLLREAKAHDVKTIDMTQGQKKSRIVAWKF